MNPKVKKLSPAQQRVIDLLKQGCKFQKRRSRQYWSCGCSRIEDLVVRELIELDLIMKYVPHGNIVVLRLKND